MPAFSAEDRKRIQASLQGIRGLVRLVHFAQTFQCELCADTRELREGLVPPGARLKSLASVK